MRALDRRRFLKYACASTALVGASAFASHYIVTSAPINHSIPSSQQTTASATEEVPRVVSITSTHSRTTTSASEFWESGISRIYQVKGFPGPVNGHHVGLETLLTLMGSNGLPFLKSANTGPINGPRGLIATDDAVLIKVNCQWPERGGTNTDLVRELIQTIFGHPEGFTGEIVVVDNGQGRGQFTWANANAEDTTQSMQKVVDSFSSGRISTFLWDNIRANRVQEYDKGSKDDGYILEDTPEPSTGMRFSYPKFRTSSGTYISLKRGIWSPESRTYSNSRLKLINFPVLKSHNLAGVTACIKHYMGIVSQSMIGNHRFIWNGGLAAEMAEVRFPTLNILDAIYVNAYPMESGDAGPPAPYSRAVKTDQMVAGLDPAAIDYWSSKNILVPAAQSLGYTTYSSLDPDNPTESVWLHNYLTESVKMISAAGRQATMDPSRIKVYSKYLT
jgi:hypothetical protein